MQNTGLECEYCKEPISLTDKKCPNCGASVSKIIKKYKEEERARNNARQEKIENDINQAFTATGKFAKTFIIIVFIMIIGISSLIVFSFVHTSKQIIENNESDNKDFFEQFEQEEDKKIEVGYNELAESKDFTVILDSYELFEYHSDTFNFQNTKNGYQKIAFHFVFDNKSKKELHLWRSELNLTADDYSVEYTDLSMQDGFGYKLIQGKENYEDLLNKDVLANSKLQGYFGFEVPKDKKELKFRYDNVTITMDNPAYQG